MLLPTDCFQREDVVTNAVLSSLLFHNDTLRSLEEKTRFLNGNGFKEKLIIENLDNMLMIAENDCVLVATPDREWKWWTKLKRPMRLRVGGEVGLVRRILHRRKVWR